MEAYPKLFHNYVGACKANVPNAKSDRGRGRKGEKEGDYEELKHMNSGTFQIK